jgi:hypothetical protein
VEDGWYNDRAAAVVIAVALVAFTAVGCAWVVHVACFDTASPVGPPEVTTPRAGYCDAINATHPWLSLTVGPTLAMALIGYALRRQPWIVLSISALMCTALVANAIYSHSLEPIIPL